MKLVSWNVNGLRACWQKGFLESMLALEADVICLQEIKLQRHQFTFDIEGYTAFTNHADKPGYSGTAIYTKKQPLSVTYGIGVDVHDHEGRVITAEFDTFYLVCCYTPNSQNELKRLSYRMEWEDAFYDYLKGLEEKKSVILCGDLNVAHKEIDLKNPKTNHMNAGFTDEERAKISRLLDSGFIDTFRHFYPDKKDEYSWWSYIGGARGRNAGWRIDYFLASQGLKDKLVSASIHQSVMGSDHCPVELVVDA